MIRIASVGMTSTTFVSMFSMSSIQPAAVAGGEADARAEQPRDPAADRTDEERGAQAVDELREDVLAVRGGAEPVLRRGRLVGRAVEGERWVAREQGPDDRQEEQRRDERRAEHELPVPKAKYSELGAVRAGRRPRPVDAPAASAGWIGATAGDDGLVGRRRVHQAPPCMPTRVRGSMKTYAMSMIRFAISTPMIRKRKTPWIRK